MTDKISLGSLTFKKYHFMKYIVLLFLAGSFVLMIFGAAVPSFDFEF